MKVWKGLVGEKVWGLLDLKAEGLFHSQNTSCKRFFSHSTYAELLEFLTFDY